MNHGNPIYIPRASSRVMLLYYYFFGPSGEPRPVLLQAPCIMDRSNFILAPICLTTEQYFRTFLTKSLSVRFDFSYFRVFCRQSRDVFCKMAQRGGRWKGDRLPLVAANRKTLLYLTSQPYRTLWWPWNSEMSGKQRDSGSVSGSDFLPSSKTTSAVQKCDKYLKQQRWSNRYLATA